ncbi:MaoC family dehydratase N-terminal domain-containing protein [Rhizobium puerariae]|uniref:MaoC family dehydratase N-terminal domain-containing protein n=1 Tax=Rhizobium puerariae TaxID=1585791 RepID=A0ABV6AIV9_9HYPH
MTDTYPREIDIGHLRSWIGREETATDTVSIDLVHKFNAMLDLSSAIPAAGDVAPLLINYCLAQPVVRNSLLGHDGHPQKGGFLPPVPLPRRMWAGSSLTFYGDFRVGDAVTRISRIADVAVKDGRSGVLCFVTVEHRSVVDGRLVVEERQDIVYREAAAIEGGARAANPATPAPAGSHGRPVQVDPTLLFRYSALTFNGHRIHYDQPYAVHVEHYQGLVVHGPLQATLLLNYARELRGSVPKHFIFRGLSPLFDHDRISLNAQEADGRLKLWTAREGGPVALSAEAVWG